jgi:hypothetical protein
MLVELAWEFVGSGRLVFCHAAEGCLAVLECEWGFYLFPLLYAPEWVFP